MGRGGWLSLVVVAMLAWGAPALAEGGDSPLGGACFDPADCDDASNVCVEEDLRGSGIARWYDGYCTRSCTPSTGCPAGGTCSATERGSYCLQGCRTGADCREFYTCALASAGGRVCIPACGSDADCAAEFVCRPCDGQCIPRQKPGALIGDACSTDEQCGPGQVCLKVNGHPQGLCSQPCGTDTCYASCPGGTTCQRVGVEQALMCVRTCSQASCGASFQCAPFPGGASGCLPPCRTQADCPAESTCESNGQCRGGGADAGCPLCGGPPDAGTPVSPVDAGTGGPGGGTAGVSCGCQGAAVNAPGFLGALVLFLVAARRRRCPRP